MNTPTVPTMVQGCRHGVSRVVASRVPWLGRWCARHRRWLAVWLIVAALTMFGYSGSAAALPLVVGFAPGLLGCCWAGLHPGSYEAVVAGPARRVYWWWFARLRWQRLARVCGLAERQLVGPARHHRQRSQRPEDVRWVAPRLQRVRTRRNGVALTIRARPGQTLAELEAGAERLATTFAAVAHRVWPISGATVVVQMVMHDALTTATTAVEPYPAAMAEWVGLGRTQAGGEWRLQLRGRHALVAGCSGSGKGSVRWGICCGLAPAVKVDMVRLWGIDLKRGVELAMGEGLFSTRAYTPADALAVLRALLAVIDQRGQAMAGTTRLHTPTVGDPLHVLVIDELAALTAYADLDIRREANRMLAEILTQGRALGVVVVACVQDPRKEVVAMRGLFTQTIALRLRSVEETVMVLGDGMSHLAPAHRISPTHPGTGWIADDTGAADRVRANYWPDDLIRQLARRFATEVHHDTTSTHDQDDQDLASAVVTPGEPVRKPRAPRKPRSPRTPRATASTASRAASETHHEEGAA
jgi:S-DNA-T family DNA segregation ATPase FtsK/SpoIIIE